MARTPKSTAKSASRVVDPSAILSAICSKSRAEDGTRAAVSSERGGVVGLYLPSLAVRYLFQVDVFPLSRIYQLTGEEGSLKSSLLWEIFRWHLMSGGLAFLAANENKDSPEMRNSIYQWSSVYADRTAVEDTYSMEGWQKFVTMMMQRLAAIMDDPKGPGRTLPSCFGIDSITATAPQSEIDDIKKTGFAKKGFALLANLISRYMKVLPGLMQDYPLTIVGTNHLKPATTATGLPTANIPGGKSVKFMETFELELKKAPQADIDTTDYAGLRIRILGRKNSVGQSRKAIHAELLWWRQPDANGKIRQYSAWDWATADIELLVGLADTPGKKTLHNEIQKYTGIVVDSKSKRLAYSDVLGYPKSGEPVPYRTLGYALLARPDILDAIYPYLGIQKCVQFKPGQDYMQAVEEARQQAERDNKSKATLPEELVEAVNLADTTPEEDAQIDAAEAIADAEGETEGEGEE